MFRLLSVTSRLFCRYRSVLFLASSRFRIYIYVNQRYPSKFSCHSSARLNFFFQSVSYITFLVTKAVPVIDVPTLECVVYPCSLVSAESRAIFPPWLSSTVHWGLSLLVWLCSSTHIGGSWCACRSLFFPREFSTGSTACLLLRPILIFVQFKLLIRFLLVCVSSFPSCSSWLRSQRRLLVYTSRSSLSGVRFSWLFDISFSPSVSCVGLCMYAVLLELSMF